VLAHFPQLTAATRLIDQVGSEGDFSLLAGLQKTTRVVTAKNKIKAPCR
jgi:hypothetical protein